MKQRLDVHSFDERLHDAEQKIDAQNPISARNALLIRRFEQYCFSEGLGKARVVKYLQSLKKLAEWFGKDFDKADRADVERSSTFWSERILSLDKTRL